MKSLWTLVAVLALANLLAIGGLVAWLGATQRLDKERVLAVKQILTDPVPVTKAKAAADESKAKDEAKKQAEDAKLKRQPTSSEQQLRERLEEIELDRQRAARLRSEASLLQKALAEQIATIETKQKSLTDEKKSLEAAQKAIADTEGNAQQRKVLSTLESLKPAQAKATLKQLIDEGVDGRAQALRYLDQMDEGVRGKVINEFIKEDPKLAAELLEGLRTRGQKPKPSTPAPGAPPT
ncbi:MAG: hypothetical protein IT432_02870 [Phycisphaerales bacterium]|nr:hypothetical protein [Phycisphaerales bacterium]